jgi:hypothetical protein
LVGGFVATRAAQARVGGKENEVGKEIAVLLLLGSLCCRSKATTTMTMTMMSTARRRRKAALAAAAAARHGKTSARTMTKSTGRSRRRGKSGHWLATEERRKSRSVVTAISNTPAIYSLSN